MPRRLRQPVRRGPARSPAPGQPAPAPRPPWRSSRDHRQIQARRAVRRRQPRGRRRPAPRQAPAAPRRHAAAARCRGRAPPAARPAPARAAAMPSAMSTRSSATRSKPRASRRSTRSDLPAPGGPISSTPSPARLAQLPWICMTAQSGPVSAERKLPCRLAGGSASVRAAMISRSDIAAAAARIAGLCPPHAAPSTSTGAELGLGFPVTLKLELLQHAGSFKPRGAFNRLLSAQRAGGRRHRRVGRQPWRRGRLCRPRAGRDSGDLRARR